MKPPPREEHPGPLETSRSMIGIKRKKGKSVCGFHRLRSWGQNSDDRWSGRWMLCELTGETKRMLQSMLQVWALARVEAGIV